MVSVIIRRLNGHHPILRLLLSSLLFMLSRSVQSMSMKASARGQSSKLVVHWFRHGDLRLHDNPALRHSLKQGNDVCLPVFCFDPNNFGDDARTPFDHLKFGSKRAKFTTMKRLVPGLPTLMAMKHFCQPASQPVWLSFPGVERLAEARKGFKAVSADAKSGERMR